MWKSLWYNYLIISSLMFLYHEIYGSNSKNTNFADNKEKYYKRFLAWRIIEYRSYKMVWSDVDSRIAGCRINEENK